MSSTDLRAYEQLCSLIKKGGTNTFCDYGCGDGALLGRISSSFPELECFGIDTFSQWPINERPQDYGRVKFVDRFSKHFDALLNSSCFDIISTVCTVHHFKHPISELRMIEGLLNDTKGQLLIVDFAFSNLFNGERVKNLLSYTSEMVSAFQGKYHRHHYTSDELEDLLSATTLKVVKSSIEQEEATEAELEDGRKRARKHLDRLLGKVEKLESNNVTKSFLANLLALDGNLIEKYPVDYSSILILQASVI